MAATVTRADGQAARTYRRGFGYDKSGRLSTASHPSGVTTLREYNARGYLAAVKDNATKKVLERYTAADAFGSVTAVTHGNGATTARGFDAKTGRTTSVETTRGRGSAKTMAQEFGYEWRTDGTLRRRAKGSGTSKLTETLTRDPLRRLTRALVSGTGGRRLDYDHDALGNLLNPTSSASADKDVELCDHRSAATAAPGPHAPRFARAGTERRAIAWDAAGRMTSVTACAGSASSCAGACTASTTADHRFVTWNARGEATRVLLGNSSTDSTPTVREDFARGPDGALHFRKTAWRENGAERVERRYMAGRFEEAVPAHASSANEWVRKTLLTDTVLHVKEKPRGGMATSSYEYLHRDHLGSVTALTDAAGTASRQTAHDPYGQRRAADWTRAETAAERTAWAADDAKSTRGFSGHGQLDRSGLVDMGGRLYDPELGIFLSPDPFVTDPLSAQSWNPYAYVGNRPLSRVDPTGFSFAPTGCNLGGVLCPGGGMGGGGGYGGGSGGFSSAARWAVEAVFGIRSRLVVNLLFDLDFGFSVHYDWQIQPHLSLTATGVKVGDDNSPADEPLVTDREGLSIFVGLFPVAGLVQSVAEVVTGRDYITKEEVHRGLATVGVAAGVLPFGKALVKAGTKIAPRIFRKYRPNPLDTKPSASDPDLQRAIDQLYKPTDKVPGGTAGALRQERRTGVPVGGKTHAIKAGERIRQLRKMARRQDLSNTDRAIVDDLMADLEDALMTPRIDP